MTEWLSRPGHKFSTNSFEDIRIIKSTQFVDLATIESVLGEATTKLIHFLTHFAEKMNTPLYIVGGVVRDLLLQQESKEIDLVVEGNAIGFADALRSTYGGETHIYPQFGTATWQLMPEVTDQIGINFDEAPDYLDFAMARTETYAYPAALPEVTPSSLEEDLHRRDFTINAMAIRLRSSQTQWQIIDRFDGIQDLEDGIFRVLHDQSFIDDPTRILRGIRLAQRLNFTLEPKTQQLIPTSFDALQKITGERIQNELSLLWEENKPADTLIQLKDLGVLSAIHPAFIISEEIAHHFRYIYADELPWQIDPKDNESLYWHVLLGAITPESTEAVCQRLSIPGRMAQSIQQTSHLTHKSVEQINSLPPSKITEVFRGIEDVALLAAWIITDDPKVRTHISSYYHEWQHIQPETTGNTLKGLGLAPGPQYRIILNLLRDERIDGIIRSSEDERKRLVEQIAPYVADDALDE